MTEATTAVVKLFGSLGLFLTSLQGGQQMADLSPTGLVGYNLMWDNCRPTLERYLTISEVLAQRRMEFALERAQVFWWNRQLPCR